MGGAVATAGAAVGVAAVAAGAAIFKLATDAGDYAGSINDAAKQSSLTTDNIQQLKYAAEQSGVSFEDITKSAAKMNVIMADAVAGNEKAAAGFNDLGVALKNADGTARSTNDVYNDTIAKLASMGDTTEATRIGTDLFGKGFANLKPLLAEGEGGINKLKNSASELGLVMSGEAITAGDTFADTLDTLKQSVGAVGKDIGVAFMPIMQDMADWLIANMPAIKAVVAVAFDGIGKAISVVYKIFNENMLPILKDLWSWIEPSIPAIKDTFKIAFDVVGSVIKSVWTVIDKLLLPILKFLFEWIGKFIPPIAAIIKASFDNIAKTVTVVVDTFNAVVNAIKSAWEWLNKWNKTPADNKNVEVKGSVSVNKNPAPVGNERYKGLAEGGTVTGTGMTWVGEEGPELLKLPKGSTVTPLDKMGGVVVTGNNFTIREEADIEKVARKLYELQMQNNRRLAYE